jgi:hypothetical protein
MLCNAAGATAEDSHAAFASQTGGLLKNSAGNFSAMGGLQGQCTPKQLG